MLAHLPKTTCLHPFTYSLNKGCHHRKMKVLHKKQIGNLSSTTLPTYFPPTWPNLNGRTYYCILQTNDELNLPMSKETQRCANKC
jgi:hypothetical protein